MVDFTINGIVNSFSKTMFNQLCSWASSRESDISKQTILDNGPFIVDLPIQDGDFPVRYVNVCRFLTIGISMKHYK